MRASAEGQRANVTIRGPCGPCVYQEGLYRVPVVGYLAEMVVSIARLPILVRSQRQIENHLVAQQERLAGHLAQTNHQLLNNIERVRQDADSLRHDAAAVRESLTNLRTSLTKLAERQKEFAVLQHQQMSALFREQQSLRNDPQAFAGKITTISSEGDEIAALLTEHLRGDREAVKKDLTVHLSVLQQLGISTEILDLGCGSGTWLELLKRVGS